MAKINYEAPFTAFRGKICKHTDIIYKKMRQTKFTSQICNPRTKPFSPDELQRQNNFKQAAAATKNILADPTQKATAENEFKNQAKYQTLYGYIFAKEYAKL